MEKKDAHRELAAKVALVFKEYGASCIVEYWGDDHQGRREGGAVRGVVPFDGKRLIGAFEVLVETQ
jgi:uncharacterized protein YbaA (DUF1428 family)